MKSFLSYAPETISGQTDGMTEWRNDGITTLFGSLKSTHRWIPPFFFIVTTIGETHSDDSIGSITSSLTSFFSSCETASLTDKGKRCSFCWTGVTLGHILMRWINPFTEPRMPSMLSPVTFATGVWFAVLWVVEVMWPLSSCMSSAATRSLPRMAVPLLTI